jgi:hypothetical protein
MRADRLTPVGRRARLRSLDARSFPILAGRADQLARLDSDAAYELGLHALIEGLPDRTRA